MTHETFLAAIVTGGGQAVDLLAYADWLEEQGAGALAYAYRWATHRGHFPRLSPKRKEATWGRRPKGLKESAARHELPWLVFEALRTHPGPMHCYDDAAAAFLALAYALAQLNAAPRMPRRTEKQT